MVFWFESKGHRVPLPKIHQAAILQHGLSNLAEQLQSSSSVELFNTPPNMTRLAKQSLHLHISYTKLVRKPLCLLISRVCDCLVLQVFCPIFADGFVRLISGSPMSINNWDGIVLFDLMTHSIDRYVCSIIRCTWNLSCGAQAQAALVTMDKMGSQPSLNNTSATFCVTALT